MAAFTAFKVSSLVASSSGLLNDRYIYICIYIYILEQWFINDILEKKTKEKKSFRLEIE